MSLQVDAESIFLSFFFWLSTRNSLITATASRESWPLVWNTHEAYKHWRTHTHGARRGLKKATRTGLIRGIVPGGWLQTQVLSCVWRKTWPLRLKKDWMKSPGKGTYPCSGAGGEWKCRRRVNHRDLQVLKVEHTNYLAKTPIFGKK